MRGGLRSNQYPHPLPKGRYAFAPLMMAKLMTATALSAFAAWTFVMTTLNEPAATPLTESTGVPAPAYVVDRAITSVAVTLSLVTVNSSSAAAAVVRATVVITPVGLLSTTVVAADVIWVTAPPSPVL